MRGLAKILLGGVLAFMVAAIAQEWTVFREAWFGASAPAPALTATDREQASRALYLFLRVSSHYYGSAGDSRFADRLRAGEGVLEELRADVDYLRANGRYQDPRLMRLEIAAAEPLAGGLVELFTREWWHVRTLRVADGTESDPPRAVKTFGRYLLRREEGEWRVDAWEPAREADVPPADPGAGAIGPIEPSE